MKGFPTAHRAKLHSTNPLERLNGEIERRTEMVGIVPDEPSIRRLVGAIPLEQNDERAVQRCRYTTLESIASIGDDPFVSLPPGRLTGPALRSAWWTTRSYTTPRDAIPPRSACLTGLP